ncbi:MAG: ABC transporter substrate-binding protein [Acidimicrobiia bacterium]
MFAVFAAGCRSDDKPAASSSSKAAGGTSDSSDATSSAASGSGVLIDSATTDLCADYQPTGGITGDTIKIGTVRPTIGAFSVYDGIATGIDKYVASVNAAGGIKAGDGKTYKLELVKGDDGYDPAKTPGEVKRLVEEENVFALVGEVGTEHNLAVRDYLNEKCVPSVAIASGAPEFGDVTTYPWQMSGIPSYATESRRFAEFVKEKGGKKVAVVYQNDLVGKAYLNSVKKGAEEFGYEVVGSESFDPLGGGTPEAQVTKLAATKADVFFVGLSGIPCPQAVKSKPADWTPMTWVSITCMGKLALTIAGPAQEGIYGAQVTYDPGAPSDAAVPAVQKLIADAGAVGASQGDVEAGVLAIGWGLAAEFGKALELTKTVDRAGIVNAMNSFSNVEGISLQRYAASTAPGDAWILEELRVVQRTNGDWTEVSPAIDYSGKSDSLAP